MEQPLVSIVVVSYNQGKYIKEILDSVKAQTYTNWDLIVADDFSSDNSVEEFKNWLATNNVDARTIFHSKNTGLATVLNEAIEICEGKYLKLIAADDFMHPECLEKSVKSLEEKGDGYGMVFTDTYCVNENSKPLPDFADYNTLGNIPAEDFRTELLKGNRIAALTVLMRLEVVKETGKYDSKFIVEDYLRWLKINEKYLIAYIPEKLSYYRWHDSNVSKTKAARIDLETIMIQMMFDYDGVLRKKINQIMSQKYLSNQKISADLFNIYKNYAYNIKRLKYCIEFSVPPFFYRAVSKFL